MRMEKLEAWTSRLSFLLTPSKGSNSSFCGVRPYIFAFYEQGWQVGVVYKILHPRVLSFVRIAKSLWGEHGEGVCVPPRLRVLCDPTFPSCRHSLAMPSP